MRAIQSFATISLVSILAACGGKTWSVDDAGEQLDFHQTKWESLNTDVYKFDYKGGQFFYSPEVSKWKEVHVADGLVIEATLKETGAEIPQGRYSDESYNIMTIGDAFLLIGSIIEEHPYNLEVTYNEEFGFPEEIIVDYDLAVSDEEEAWYFTNFTMSP